MTDFYRPVVALLGLPVDAVGMQYTVDHLERARQGQQRCFLSTPNLNFAMQSQTDPALRDSVCRSHLSVVDGMPLVWIAKLLGLPVKEKVSGSNLFEHLRRSSATPWRVFFFGGPQGVGQKACEVLQRSPAEMQGVGHLYPGFADLDAMSNPEWIASINAAAPELLVVSIGLKGQSWVSRNFAQLQAPVIANLGAVINFVAGTVQRAPRWVQNCGLEWLWRIKEEPQLWRRYWRDGMALLRTLFTQVIPLALHTHMTAKPGPESQPSRAEPVQANPAQLCLMGACHHTHLLPIRQAFAQALACNSDVRLDLSQVSSFDSTFVALLMLLDTAVRDAGHQFSITGLKPQHRRLLDWHGAKYLTQTP